MTVKKQSNTVAETKKLKEMPKVSIVIINWNSGKDIGLCLESLRKTKYDGYEVIVVDNGSTDGSTEMIEKDFTEVRIIRNGENLGAAGANNIGMKDGFDHGADYVWILNNDVEVKPDTISKLVSYAEGHPQFGLFSPVLYYHGTKDKIQYAGSTIDLKKQVSKTYTDIKEFAKTDQKKAWLWSTAILVKKDVYQRIGSFREKFFAYCDDMEYSLRAQNAGFGCAVVPKSKLYHKSHSIDLGGKGKLPLHYFFFNSRNECWALMPVVPKSQRLGMWRKYMARVIRRITSYQIIGCEGAIEPTLDGLWCGIKGRGGPWDKEVHIPKLLSRFIMWKPYLWADLLEGNFGKLFRGAFRKIKGA